MRIRLDFFVHKLPIIYRNRFIALIKAALSESDKNYKERLYPDKSSEYSKVAKPFCFSVRMPVRRDIRIEKISVDDGIEINERVFYFSGRERLSLYISSSDFEFITNLYNGLQKMRSFQFNNEISMHFIKAYLLNERKIASDEVVFKTLSPVLIEDKNEKPLIPSDYELLEFKNELNAIHQRILKDIRNGEGLFKELEFEPVRIKKQVVKHTLRGFREKTCRPYMTLTCFEGCFKLKGDPRDLQMLYQIGIGLRTGQGLGMVEVI